jgi:addiction module RelE/StbE family toxin
LDRYTVFISPQAYRDLEEIYAYIATELLVPYTAADLVDEIEEAILSLEQLPERGAERKTGIYANKGYKQLFVKNYTIVYRVDSDSKTVLIITVKYSHQNF